MVNRVIVTLHLAGQEFAHMGRRKSLACDPKFLLDSCSDHKEHRNNTNIRNNKTGTRLLAPCDNFCCHIPIAASYHLVVRGQHIYMRFACGEQCFLMHM